MDKKTFRNLYLDVAARAIAAMDLTGPPAVWDVVVKTVSGGRRKIGEIRFMPGRGAVGLDRFTINGTGIYMPGGLIGEVIPFCEIAEICAEPTPSPAHTASLNASTT